MIAQAGSKGRTKSTPNSTGRRWAVRVVPHELESREGIEIRIFADTLWDATEEASRFGIVADVHELFGSSDGAKR